MKRAIPIAIALVFLSYKDAKAASTEDFESWGKTYAQRVLPLAERYCFDCHDADTKKGELDLQRFGDLSAVRADPKTWQNVLFQLETGEMPPKDKPQLSAEDRTFLLDWVERYLHAEAGAQAGDPGPVMIRRLSNAEYTYTIHDLTGIDSLAPAREFPVDGAAGEGFTNVGEALTMSPALVGKYLDAAKEVAEHAVLLPEGIEFSRYTSRRDQTNELIARIKEIYHRHTYAVEGDDLPSNLEGIKLTHRVGGLLPVEKHLAATLVGSKAELSPKYLISLASTLKITGGPGAPLFDPIRKRWARATSPEDASALAEEIGKWQGML